MTGSEIKLMRDCKDLTQTELARICGVHPITVSKWERGIAHPSVFTAAILNELAALDMDTRGTEELKRLCWTARVLSPLTYVLTSGEYY